jgi:hypothetical protein
MQHNFEVLRVFIPQDRLLAYNTDWNNFCDFCRTISDEKCTLQHSSFSDNATGIEKAALKESDPKEVFHTLVENLLKHTHV